MPKLQGKNDAINAAEPRAWLDVGRVRATKRKQFGEGACKCDFDDAQLYMLQAAIVYYG